MLGAFHHRARRQHRVARTENAGDRAGGPVEAVHHRGVHLVAAGRGIDGAAAGVEQRVVLQRHHRGRHRVQRRAAAGQHRMAGTQHGAQPGVEGRLELGVHSGAAHGAGAAVDDENRSHLTILQRSTADMADTVFTQPTAAAMLAASKATPRGAIRSASGMVAARSARATEFSSSSSR